MLSEVEDMLNNLINNKSGLPYENIKNNRHALARYLSDLLNVILTTRMYPGVCYYQQII